MVLFYYNVYFLCMQINYSSTVSLMLGLIIVKSLTFVTQAHKVAIPNIESWLQH